MRPSGRMLPLVAMLVLLWMIGCDPLARRRARIPKCPAQPERTVVVVAPPKPPEAPPPAKCRSLEDKCVAKADTRVDVVEHQVTFQPPEGWVYARADNFGVAVPPEDDVALGFVEAPSADPDRVIGTLSPLLDELKISNVKLPNLKPRFQTPQSSMDATGGAVNIWEVDKGNQGVDPKMKDVAGKLVVFVATIDAKVIVGAAFMQRRADASRGTAAGQAVRTLRSGP